MNVVFQRVRSVHTVYEKSRRGNKERRRRFKGELPLPVNLRAQRGKDSKSFDIARTSKRKRRETLIKTTLSVSGVHKEPGNTTSVRRESTCVRGRHVYVRQGYSRGMEIGSRNWRESTCTSRKSIFEATERDRERDSPQHSILASVYILLTPREHILQTKFCILTQKHAYTAYISIRGDNLYIDEFHKARIFLNHT